MDERASGRNASKLDATQFMDFGKERADAMFNVQKELLDGYEEASRAWIARLRSEVALWSQK